MEVTSEVLPDFIRDDLSKPEVDPKHIVSKIWLTVCKSEITRDEDGDYQVQRRNQQTEILITLEHRISTVLSEVGLQVWRGALLLADFLLNNSSILVGQNVLELGAGVGLTSLVAGMFANSVTCTDLDQSGILDLLRCNIHRNTKYLKSKMNVLPMDFFNLNWSNEVVTAVDNAAVILAADVIYDNAVTNAFLRTIERLFDKRQTKLTMYLALEKRYVFTIADLDTVAPCYEHLLEAIQHSATISKLSMRQLNIDFPQKIRYDRVKELVLWKINN